MNNLAQNIRRSVANVGAGTDIKVLLQEEKDVLKAMQALHKEKSEGFPLYIDSL